MHTMGRAILTGLSAVFLVSLSLAAAAQELSSEAIFVPGARFRAPNTSAVLAVAARLKRADLRAPAGREIRLAAAQPRAVTSSPLAGKLGLPLQIGFHRALPQQHRQRLGFSDLAWEASGTGLLTTLTVNSPGAAAVRQSLYFHVLPVGAEVRVYAPAAPDAALGPFGAETIDADPQARAAGESPEPFWSPVVDGDTVAVEIWVPSRSGAETLAFTLGDVSHLTRGAVESRDLSGIGNSQECERDMACDKKWLDSGDSVAKVIFESSGGTFLCTGTLLNDTDPSDFRPLFLTAAHCIDNRREARSASFFWFFQRLQCNGDDPTSVTQTSGGARLKFTVKAPSTNKPTTDHTLLELKRSPPDGVTFSGWSFGDVEDLRKTKIRGIHHPAGDLKKVSRGNTRDLVQWQQDGAVVNIGTEEPLTHHQVDWRNGVTEGGSSGSGIWTGRKWPKQFLIGILTGGSSFCSSPDAPDFYGRFDMTYKENRRFRRLLVPGSK